MERVILHSDLNNFYASVECLHQPQLRGKPVAVAGDREARHGIVLAKNEAAKRCGVKTGSPLWLAKQKCKDIVFVPPHHNEYMKFSKLVRKIYSEYTDQVESFGLDECWLDVSESASLFGNGRAIADTIRHRIKAELGLTVSIGVSYNKIFAKLGSDLKKPDATTVIRRENFQGNRLASFRRRASVCWNFHPQPPPALRHRNYRRSGPDRRNVFGISPG